MIAGMVISLEISSLTAWLVITAFFRRKTLDLMRRNLQKKNNRGKRMLTGFSIAAGLVSLFMLGYGLVRFKTAGPVLFFISGTFLLIGILLLAIRIFRHRTQPSFKTFDRAAFGRSNLWRNSSRSLSVILLFAIGIFMVVAIGANRKSIGPGESGTGGFRFYMETTVPVPDNLNNLQVRAKYGLETASAFVQMKQIEGDDASCLNLNRVTNPPLLGIPSKALAGRFSFISLKTRDKLSDPWVVLEQDLKGGAIPAVVDQTVIEWGLGLKTGDTLKYKSENGDTVDIVLAGGLAGSVVQGNILISETQMMRHWPSVSGTRVMLVAADPKDSEQVRSEISRVFRDYGTDLKPADERLADFNAVENTYLSIFLVMGALAMLLGTIGLAIILARNLQERKSEIALLRATGFSKQRILGLVVREYSTLLILGILAGGIPALISVLPVMFQPSAEVSVVYLVTILAILIANGFFWIFLLGWDSVRKPGIIESLREE
jgi:ABC-type antimicrobial peptide transport system permease subunit